MSPGQAASRLLRPFRFIRGIGHEVAGGWRVTADLRSFVRLAVDVLQFRVLGLVDLPWRDLERHIRLRGGIELTYRLNRGDRQSIREGWIEEVYRLPFDLKVDTLVDLGANIGLTSLWLARRYRISRIIAVEPSAQNARLTRLNLFSNEVPAEVIESSLPESAMRGPT